MSVLTQAEETAIDSTVKRLRKARSALLLKTVGSLTGNPVTRQRYYERPCVMALIPFLNCNMYTDAKRKAPGPSNDTVATPQGLRGA